VVGVTLVYVVRWLCMTGSFLFALKEVLKSVAGRWVEKRGKRGEGMQSLCMCVLSNFKVSRHLKMLRRLIITRLSSPLLDIDSVPRL
jgi:hypothetical protein